MYNEEDAITTALAVTIVIVLGILVFNFFNSSQDMPVKVKGDSSCGCEIKKVNDNKFIINCDFGKGVK